MDGAAVKGCETESAAFARLRNLLTELINGGDYRVMTRYQVALEEYCEAYAASARAETNKTTDQSYQLGRREEREDVRQLLLDTGSPEDGDLIGTIDSGYHAGRAKRGAAAIDQLAAASRPLAGLLDGTTTTTENDDMAKQRTSAEIRRHLDDSLDSVVSAATSTMSPDGAEQIKRWRVTFAQTLDLLIRATKRELVEAEKACPGELNLDLLRQEAKDGA